MNELYEKRRDQMFPRLTPAQIARVEAHGERMATRAGDILVEPCQREPRLLVVLSGALEALLPASAGEQLITTLLPGDFAGEMSTLRGVPGFVRIRVREAGEVLSIADDEVRAIVQTDAELSEIFMRAFILRRMGLISSPSGELTVIGSRHSGNTLQLREFLTRNAYPHVSIDAEDPSAQELLQSAHASSADIPVMIGRCGRVLRNPAIRTVADFLQINPVLEESAVHDLIVVGAGPAGLAAAVYAASEGLDVRVIDGFAPGGQAGSSSRIENYLGFPTGISGQALAGRALVQSQKFGAKFTVACDAMALGCQPWPYRIELADGRSARARTIVIASGAQYRKPEISELDKFTGAGVYYAATHLESKLCEGADIVVVGGGNSAGQAAVFLAGGCRQVHILVRSSGLAESMSHYLIRRIEECPNITLHTHSQITRLEGADELERLSWRDERSGREEQHPIGHVFLMTGAAPNTAWLKNCVDLDGKGFVRTGVDLVERDLAAARWPLSRAPYLLETSLPGVFAVGDVRSGSVKRIAAAVGEGSTCVQFVHRALRDLPVQTTQRASAVG